MSLSPSAACALAAVIEFSALSMSVPIALIVRSSVPSRKSVIVVIPKVVASEANEKSSAPVPPVTVALPVAVILMVSPPAPALIVSLPSARVMVSPPEPVLQ